MVSAYTKSGLESTTLKLTDHCTCGEFRYGNHITFWQRKWHTKEIVKRIQRLDCTLQGELTRTRLSGWRIHCNHDAMAGLSLHVIEFADAKGQKIGAHPWRIQEFYELLRPQGLRGLGGHVTQAIEMGWNNKCETKNGLTSRLVPTGKRSSGIESLKLSAGHDLGLAMNVGIEGAIEACHLVVQESSVVDRKHDVLPISRKVLGKDESGRGCLETDAELKRK